MRLSAELFEQISEALTSDRKSDKDKRREPRVGMAGEATMVTLLPDGKRAAMKVRIRDISRSGIGAYYTKRFAKGQRFIVQLQSMIDEPIWLVCVTAYCRRSESDRYVVGGRIQQVLKPDQVQFVQERHGEAAVETILGAEDQLRVDRIAKAILS